MQILIIVKNLGLLIWENSKEIIFLNKKIEWKNFLMWTKKIIKLNIPLKEIKP